MYTIKSISDEGTYYLCKGWHDYKKMRMWVKSIETKSDLFTSISVAKASLTKLLNIMDEYSDDTFSVVKVNDDFEIIQEVAL